MKTNKEQESGNALIYVLIAIALFAALSFTLARQTDSSEAGTLSDERAELYATQIISYAAQTKSALDQMLFIGTDIDDLDFIDPSDAGFNAGTQRARSNRVFHPEGGGLILGRIPPDAVDQNITTPVAGWYLGSFNNIEWTALAAGNTAGPGGAESPFEDVILVAYQLKESVCSKINEKVNGSSTIPVMGDSIKESMIDASFYAGTNVELTTDPTGAPICVDCHEIASLCVRNQAGDAYGFYTVIADQ